MTEPVLRDVSVEVHVWRYLSYRDLLPLLDALEERFVDVRTRRETEGPVQAGGGDAGLTLAILIGTWVGAEVLKAFLSELTKDAYREVRTQLLRLFPKAGATHGALQFLPLTVVIGSVRFSFEGELTDEEFLRRLRKADEYVRSLSDEELLDQTPRPPEATRGWDEASQSWR